jgi:hypothetical protein
MRNSNASGGSAVGVRARVVAVAFQVAVKAGAANAKNLRRAEAILAHLQHFLDVHLANIVERKRLPLIIARKPRDAVLEVLGEVADVDEIAGGGDAGGRDYVFEFAHISWPGMLEEQSLGATRKTHDIFAIGVVVFLQEKLNE